MIDAVHHKSSRNAQTHTEAEVTGREAGRQGREGGREYKYEGKKEDLPLYTNIYRDEVIKREGGKKGVRDLKKKGGRFGEERRKEMPNNEKNTEEGVREERKKENVK